MYKRGIALVLLFGLLISFAGCSLGTDEANNPVQKPGDSTTKNTANPEDITVINGNIPESAKYIRTIDEITSIKANTKELEMKIEKKLGRKPKILISSFHMTNDWNRLVSRSAIDAGKEMGAEVIVTNAEGNWNKQVKDIDVAISSKVDAIVIAGGIAKALQEVIRKASKAKIIVTTVDIPSPNVLTCVNSDNYSGAAMLAMKMALDMKGKGNIAVIYSPGWHSIDIRRWMLDEILKDWPDIQIVKEQPVDEEDAINGTTATMESILQKYPNKGSLNAVYTAFGLAGVGAARAIEAANRSDEIAVYTVDADIIVLKDMLQNNGAIKACVGQTTNQLGRTATIAALKGIAGESEDIFRQTFCPITLVTRDNANEIGKYLYKEEWK